MGIKSILEKNTFHARIFILILYFEKKCKIKIFFKVLRKFVIQGIYCSEIHPDSFTNINAVATLRLPHPYMIIIHKSAEIGENCTIFHECTIGVVEKGESRIAAKLGNNVYIGCKSIILGELEIGNSSKIGAGSLILKDIGNGATIVGLWK